MFCIALRVQPGREGLIVRPSMEYDAELDNVTSLLIDLCDQLASLDVLEFFVSGFGEERWPATVDVDLATILEQMPEVRAALTEKRSFNLDFYEQSLQRFLHFEFSGDNLVVTCNSFTSWIPTPSTLEIRLDELVNSLQQVRKVFFSSIDFQNFESLPRLWIEEWWALTDFSGICKQIHSS